MKFTDRYLQKLQPREKMFEVLEGDGFTLRVLPSGRKSFYYIYKAGGVNHRMPLGIYPHVSLSEARGRHRELLTLRERGIDPAREEKRRAEAKAQALSVKELAKEYMEKHAIPHKSSWRNDEAILNKDVLPAWGERAAAEIRKRDVIVLLEGIVKRGAPNQSTQTLKVVRKMFNFAVERDLLDHSPCAQVKALVPSVAKERALSEEEIGIFWRALEESELSSAMVRGLRLILITGQRPGECFGLTRGEITGTWWTLPAGRAKNRREHTIYLSRLARWDLGPGKAEVVFPGSGGTIMQKDAPARAVRRLLARINAQRAREDKPALPPFTPHDLRRTCATHLGALGYDNEQIGRVLNHVDGRVTATYNRHRYDSLKREMLLAWSRRLLRIVKENPPS